MEEKRQFDMKCPNCGEDDNGVHKIHSEHNFMMKKNLRTRHCRNCGYFFDTEEEPAGDVFKLKNGRKVKKQDEGQGNIFDTN